MKMRGLYNLLLFLLVPVCLWSSVSAQSGITGEAPGSRVLSGVVEDQTGGILPGARLTIVRKGTNEARETRADELGRFTFQGLPQGRYSLRAEAKDYGPAELPIMLDAGDLTSIRVLMKVSIREEITVTDDKPVPPLSPERNTDAVKLDDNLLGSLPAEGQNIFYLISNLLSPAAQETGGASVVVDGVESSQLDMPVAAVRRVLVNKNPYSAEFRRPGKGRIEVTTREGSHRHFHGGGGIVWRDSALDARNPLARGKPDLDRRVFNAVFSGPLSGKSVSFLLSGERFVADEGAVVNARTPDGPLVENVPQPLRRGNLLARVDARLGEVHTFTFRFDLSQQHERNREAGGFHLAEQGTSGRQEVRRLLFSDRAIVSSSFQHEFRFSFERELRRSGRLATAPAVTVIGAFSGGPSQIFRENREVRLEFQDVNSYFRGPHTLRFGGTIRPRSIEAFDRSNFGGTFEFSGLDSYVSGTPFLFRIYKGEPDTSFSDWLAGAFFQDEIKVRSDLSVILGLRYDWQSSLNDGNNLAPRVSLAFAPGKQKTVLRAGAGVFYEYVPERVRQQSLLHDGRRIRDLIFPSPSFPNPFGGREPELILPSVIRIAPDLRNPYLIQATISLEREIWKRGQLAVEYQMVRGVHLLRSRNSNAPMPASGLRADPNVFNINQVESSASMRGNALAATFRIHVVKLLRLTAQYTLSRTTNDTAGPLELPADNFHLSPEMGRADFDRRHRFNFFSLAELPAGFRLGSVLRLSSSAPFDITTGFDDNRDTVANDRPAGVRRNTGRGPAFAQLDLRLARLFHLPRVFDYGDHTSRNFEISLDAFNVFNRTNFSNFVGALNSPFFGRANSALPARTLQLSAKYSF